MTPDELLAIARAATPGEWKTSGLWPNVFDVAADENDRYKHIANTYSRRHTGASANNAIHIATFSPARVIALLEFVQAWDAWEKFEIEVGAFASVFDALEESGLLRADLLAKRRALDEA